ncbi:MAG: nucleotidyltransferase family protein [Candidatus Peribacteraceae bacterium]|nr:nucleotidyltransferase family protein [Candidatus Peribacteraceae bacterium]
MPRLQFLQKNRQKILALADKRGGYNVRVFGSVVRGEEGKASDVDFLMSFRRGTTLFDRGGLLSDLRDYLECDVDVVSDKTVHPLIRDDVNRSAIAL